ncbi:MAG: crossover junction endodeoxyribonuclease RuvC [Alphaproteobacteria bacterium]|nr:crossover junction endodeoxyribonuclease RuvC [Alphaproteobacteria bacterium]MBV9693558.1 crossover junction endodeoxyribonuclease RuvC [Alphaproteobacteria bacterium]
MNHPALVLGVHPTSRGFGWALFESPARPLDWGIVEIRSDRNAETLKRVERLLHQYQPQVLALEQFDREPARRAGRIRKLGAQLVSLAQKNGIKPAILARSAIGTAITREPNATRYEIAQAIARDFDALRHRLPPKRKPWESERPNLSLFSAAACALTWFTEL